MLCRPACETVLLHFEQFKIPEKLARFAVKHGMSGFVKTLAVNIGDFVESRRKRVKPVCSSLNLQAVAIQYEVS